MNEVEFTIPRFKDWVKPTSVLEALERSLAHARVEEKWSGCGWFETDLEVETDYDYNVSPESHAEVTKQIEGMVCTDVKACSAGIVAIQTLDGEALWHFLANEDEMNTDIIKDDPICWGAIEVLAEAFSKEFVAEEQEVSRFSRDLTKHDNPLSCVIYHNDNGSSNEGHHSRIVRGFERAVDMAKEQPVK